MMNQCLKRLRDARKKFEDYQRNIGENDEIRFVVFTDNSDFEGNNAHIEHFIGRKMGGISTQDDVTGIIDAVIFVQHPLSVWDDKNSYWFKCIIKKRLSPSDRKIALQVAGALHHRMSHHALIHPLLSKFRAGRFRALIA